MKKFLLLLVALVATSAVAMAQDTWTVAGTAAILNGTDSWAPANAANDMVSTDGVNFTLAVEGKTLEAGVNYEYKVVKNHAWSEAYPGNNATLTVNETAVYTVNYTFNAETKDVAAEAVKTGNAGEITHEYSVAGSSADLFGAAWSETNTATNMTKGDDGIYAWTSAETALAVSTIEFKVVEDHSWGVSYGYGSGNATFSVTEAGKYVLKFTFDPESKYVGCEVVSFTPEAVEATYFIKHDWAGEGNWTWQEMTKLGEMTTEEGGKFSVYSYEGIYGGNGCNINTAADDTGAQWFAEPELTGSPMVGDLCAFRYSPELDLLAIINLNPEPVNTPSISKITIKGQELEIEEDKYYYSMTVNENFDESDVEVEVLNADEDTNVTVSVMNAQIIKSEEYRQVTVTLYQGEELVDQYSITVTIDDTPTGINDINVNSAKVVKTIENDQVVILKGDKKFNVAGQAVK
ncbi:hypothetical protein [Sodaliphilus sp.]|uniref:pullulanase X25 domain-containing protein n=1 Tax=Sodaliphilus sp. TaxID=2815818 RepID=UPI00388E3A76